MFCTERKQCAFGYNYTWVFKNLLCAAQRALLVYASFSSASRTRLNLLSVSWVDGMLFTSMDIVVPASCDQFTVHWHCGQAVTSRERRW